MVAEERIRVAPGLALPFYPARPMMGFSLRTPEQAVKQLERDLDAGYVCQPKLNGDRATAAIVEAIVIDSCPLPEEPPDKMALFQNRHGGWLHQTVKNKAAFLSLPIGTCLDGEVMPGGLFHPFECLAYARESWVNRTTIERVRLAELVCRELGVPWLFAPMMPGTVAKLRKNLPFCEGYVRKDNGPYPIGSSANDESRAWVKMKF